MEKHISYSQYNTYVTCPRSWYLGKVKNAEEKMTWYLPIGSAVHVAIDNFLGGYDVNLQSIFYELIEEQMKIEPDTTKWLSGGSEDDPIIEDKALTRAQECFDKAIDFINEIEVHQVEADISGRLPGLTPEIKAFADILGEHKKHGPIILDWKTGSSKPKTNFQLETYRALTIKRDYKTGLWAMLAPGASKARPVDLSDVSPKDVGEKYQAVWERMQRKLYQTNAGFGCRFCFHQDNCKLNAGPTRRARYYDKSEQEGMPY